MSREPAHFRMGAIQKKILLLLGSGIALGLCGSPRQYFRIVRAFRDDWKEIANSTLSKSVKSLKDNGYIRYQKSKDGDVSVQLTRKGILRTNKLKFEQRTIKAPKLWDEKWRVVAFDIPCARNNARNALRHHLRRVGFVEVQKSIFVHPYPCKKLIDSLTRYHAITKYVTYMRVDKIDRTTYLKKHFNL